MPQEKTQESGGAANWAGRHPFPPDEKRPCILNKTTSIPRVYGTPPHQVPTALHVSTDHLSCTEFRVPPGEYFAPADVHSGDEVYYILEGTATVFDPEAGTVYTVEEGDVFLIPSGTFHQTFNFTDRPLTVLCAFAPEIWPGGDKGAIEAFKGTAEYYKGT